MGGGVKGGGGTQWYRSLSHLQPPACAPCNTHTYWSRREINTSNIIDLILLTK